jgi:DNA-binding transcriptional ArsR family regulator
VKRYQDIADPSLAKALAHPMRTRILSALENRTASPSELAEELDASLGVVSYHVRRLHALRFLKLVKRVARRGAVEHYYTTVAGPTITDAAWGATPTIVKQAMLSATLNEIGMSVSTAANAGGFECPQVHVSRTPLTVDEQGWKALARELETLLARVDKIHADSQKRLLRNDHADAQQATVVLMMFDSSAQSTPDDDAHEHGLDGRARRATRRRRPAAVSKR